MTEREWWKATVELSGKESAYRVAHASEYDAKPFWTEFPDGFGRLARYAWAVEIDEWCAKVSRGDIPAA